MAEIVERMATVTSLSRKYRGLGIMRAEWEGSLQNINILRKLESSNTPLLPILRPCDVEIDAAGRSLNVDITTSVKSMREVLREREFEVWEKMPLRGLGVSMYKEKTHCNKWVYEKKILSSSEWTTGLKMSANIAGVRAIPGRNSGITQCRHAGCLEKETLPHVLGSCPKNELLRNTRHHTVRSTIASELRRLGWSVDEETSCISEDSSTRRCDIVAVKPDRSMAVILDPTIRFEQNSSHPENVDIEKRSIYEPCIADLARRYQIDPQKFKVVGLLLGARGAIPSFTWNILTEFGLTNKTLTEISLQILKDSIRILNIHLFQ